MRRFFLRWMDNNHSKLSQIHSKRQREDHLIAGGATNVDAVQRYFIDGEHMSLAAAEQSFSNLKTGHFTGYEAQRHFENLRRNNAR